MAKADSKKTCTKIFAAVLDLVGVPKLLRVTVSEEEKKILNGKVTCLN